jgi:hypothetical protein
MIWSALADGLVVIHFAFTAFVIFGGFLTPLENHWRHLAGQAGYGEGFLTHYLVRVLYPAGLTWHIQRELAALLVAINVVAYVGLVRRPRRRA